MDFPSIEASAPRPSVSPRLQAAALLALTLVVFAGTFRNGFIWDDDDYIINNETLQNADGLSRIWFDIGATPQYYPLVFTTFWLEHHVWGLHPVGYHVVNVLLHAASAILLWLVLRRLEVPGAWLAAALFAIHPVQVESVAWITERKNVLAGVFVFATMLCYLEFAGIGRRANRAIDGRAWYVTALALFTAALLSKTVACTLPFVLAALIWWKRGKLTRHDLLPLLPLVAMGAALGLLTVWVERHHVGTKFVDLGIQGLDRPLIAGRAIWFYLSKLVAPVSICFNYPRWTIDPHVGWYYVWPAAVLLLTAALWRQRSVWGRGPFTAWACFIIVLGPALGFVDVYPMRYSFVADHFQYLACAAPLALLAALGVGAWQRFATSSLGPRVVIPMGVLAALGGLSWKLTHNYAGNDTVWRATIRTNPQSWMAMTNYAHMLAADGQSDEATKLLRKALTLRDDMPEIHRNLGSLLMSTEPAAALTHLRRAVELAPNDSEQRTLLATALEKNGQLREAYDEYSLAARLDPHNEVAAQGITGLLAKANSAQRPRLLQ